MEPIHIDLTFQSDRNVLKDAKNVIDRHVNRQKAKPILLVVLSRFSVDGSAVQDRFVPVETC